MEEMPCLMSKQVTALASCLLEYDQIMSKENEDMHCRVDELLDRIQLFPISSACRLTIPRLGPVLTASPVAPGDAFTMVFHDAVDAVAWALSTQIALLQAPWPSALLEHPKASEEWYVHESRRLQDVVDPLSARKLVVVPQPGG